ncbi:vacuolar sorting protein 9 domain-containing protein [Babesia caballi]|uniref:Vacuolar sorting protein 9 domain-containing protein n=1 Tax=Babesia caballi TaxID=5871 RepID=A0AAV4LW12_BABCB|nr:vacuolar sorting protein 9 domain-containing protein [Babesia caballi]
MAAPAWNETGSEIELTTLSGAEEASDSLASVEPRAYSVPSFDISSNDNVEYDASEATSVASTDCNEDADATLESESEFPRTRSARVIPIDAAAEGAYDGYDLAPLATTSSDAAASERWPPSANDLGAESPLSSLTPYNRFLERLKHRSCVDTIRAVKGLLAMFPGQMSRSDAAAVVHNFIDIHTPRLLSTDPFVALAEDERAASAEFFEKFTLQKLYPQ